jgi:hypothetical protein
VPGLAADAGHNVGLAFEKSPVRKDTLDMDAAHNQLLALLAVAREYLTRNNLLVSSVTERLVRN